MGRAARRRSQAVEEGDQRGAAGRRQGGVGVARGRPPAAMPQDRLLGAAGPAVMEKARLGRDLPYEAQPPERGGAPFRARRLPLRQDVGQALAHAVQQEVRIGPDQLEGMLGPVGQPRGDQGGHVAGRAARRVDQRLGPAARAPRPPPRGGATRGLIRVAGSSGPEARSASAQTGRRSGTGPVPARGTLSTVSQVTETRPSGRRPGSAPSES